MTARRSACAEVERSVLISGRTLELQADIPTPGSPVGHSFFTTRIAEEAAFLPM
jgi:hypothetical protein